MNVEQRAQLQIRVTGYPVWENGNVTTHLSETVRRGTMLMGAIAQAINVRDNISKCIEAMSELLVTGETMEEYEDRIAAEDAEPRSHATGWFLIEEFAAACDPGPTGFQKFIKNIKGRIVRPRGHARMIGTNWPQYPSSGFHWADYFDFADSWHEALAIVRKERAAELRARFK
jgi:hypothetical protein